MKLAQALLIDACVIAGVCIIGYALGGLVGMGIGAFGIGLALSLGSSLTGEADE